MAVPADPNYWLPLITAGGAIVAAIITGFGAAALKHRWDVPADKVRWERERSERRRDELKSAFIRYLASRSGLERAMFVAAFERTPVILDGVFNAQADYLHSLAELQTILDDRSFVAMEEEIKSFPHWAQEMLTGMADGESTYKPPPDHQSIVKLAQKLIRG